MRSIMAMAVLAVFCLAPPSMADGVNKRDLVASVAELANLTPSDAAGAVDAVFAAITKSLANRQDVRLVGFGTFLVVRGAATIGRNPRTGERIEIPESIRPKFKAGKDLKGAVNPRRESEMDSSTIEQPTTASPSVMAPDGSVEPTLREHGMIVGTVKWFSPAKGFGFIEPEDGSKDVFVHISAVRRVCLTSLSEGQKIRYELIPGDNGGSTAENLAVME